MEAKDNKHLLRQYAAMGTQFLAAIGIAVFAGLKLDEWMGFTIPLLIWLLPLLMIIAMIFRMVRATSQKNEKKK